MTVTDHLDDRLRHARLGILSATVAGDAGLAYELVRGLLAEGVSFESVLFDVIAPLQSEVGMRWQHGDFSIAEEHASTGAVETVVSLLAGSLATGAEEGHVVVGCAEGDAHSLPARIVACHLAYLGRRTTFLGAGLPADDLASYLGDVQPDALVLACSMTGHLPRARAAVRAAHHQGVPVLVGGRAFGSDGRRAVAIGADGWVPDARRTAAVLDGWAPDIAASERGITETGVAEAASLEGDRAAIIEAAVSSSPDSSAADLRAGLSLLIEGVIASVLVADPTVVTELTRWHDSLGREHVSTRSLVSTLRALLDPTSRAAAHLDEALGSLDSA